MIDTIYFKNKNYLGRKILLMYVRHKGYVPKLVGDRSVMDMIRTMMDEMKEFSKTLEKMMQENNRIIESNEK